MPLGLSLELSVDVRGDASTTKGPTRHLLRAVCGGAYDSSIKDEILVSDRTAEYLIRKHLEKGAGRATHLPPSLTSADSRELLERYIHSADANLNYVRLIAEAKDHPPADIDAKLRLRARRRAEQLNAELFAESQGFQTGVDMSLVDDQEAPVLTEVDQHGSQPGADDNEHVRSYLIGLRLMIAIVIKINDEFTLAAAEVPGSTA